MKDNKKVKKYKTKAGLKRALTYHYNQGTVFYSDDKKTQELLKDLGVAVYGVSGVGIGFAFGGPKGALIGGILGLVTGLLVTEKIKIKHICFHRSGFCTMTFV